MKFSYTWLRDYCPANLPADKIARQLTAIGLEVESFTRVGDDVIFDVDVVPVRSDCLSVVGLAREISFLTGAPLTLPPSFIKEVHLPKELSVNVDLVARDLCPRYSARIVTDIRVGPSPRWLAQRLEAVGVRSLNNVVDITNFVNLEMGQPLHAFDLAKLRGRKLVIRRAAAGEKLVLIDGRELALYPEDLVIADAEGPVALAGVMGGRDSEVSPASEAVVLESAYFDPVSVRRTARRYGTSTESSYRFERGTDPAATLAAADRAAALMAELAGGTILGPAADEGRTEWSRPAIVLRPSRANMLLGTNLTGEDMAVLLRRLYFDVGLDRMENLVISAPSYRRDVNTEIDVVEEVARAYGYDNVEATLPAGRPPVPAHVPREEFESAAREILVAAGFFEVYTPSFTNPEKLAPFGLDGEAAVAVANPTVSQFSHLRPALWPALADIAARNGRLGAPSALVFEIGTVFEPGEEGRVVERHRVAALAAGEAGPRHWSRPAPQADFFFAKGVAEALATAFGVPLKWEADRFALGEAEGQYVRVPLEPFGEGHVLEFDAGPLYGPGAAGTRCYRPISRFPSIGRDLALLVDDGTPAADVVAVLRDSSELVRDVSVFDVFTGEGLPPGRKSLGIRIRYQADDRTLTDEEANAARAQALDAVAERFGATLRSP